MCTCRGGFLRYTTSYSYSFGWIQCLYICRRPDSVSKNTHHGKTKRIRYQCIPFFCFTLKIAKIVITALMNCLCSLDQTILLRKKLVSTTVRALRNLFCGLMNLGQKNRAVDSTSMNDQSSRSHRCVQIRFVS
jgi:hypothetical protein